VGYILYVKRDCPFCVQAQELLESREQEYSLIDIQDYPALTEEIKKAYNWSTVPMVFSAPDQQFDPYHLVGGFSELRALLSTGVGSDV